MIDPLALTANGIATGNDLCSDLIELYLSIMQHGMLPRIECSGMQAVPQVALAPSAHHSEPNGTRAMHPDMASWPVALESIVLDGNDARGQSPKGGNALVPTAWPLDGCTVRQTYGSNVLALLERTISSIQSAPFKQILHDGMAALQPVPMACISWTQSHANTAVECAAAWVNETMRHLRPALSRAALDAAAVHIRAWAAARDATDWTLMVIIALALAVLCWCCVPIALLTFQRLPAAGRAAVRVLCAPTHSKRSSKKKRAKRARDANTVCPAVQMHVHVSGSFGLNIIR